MFEDTENGGGDEESYQAVTHADAFACIPRAKPPRIVFNRVYKTGSVEFGAVLDVMSVANNFSYAAGGVQFVALLYSCTRHSLTPPSLLPPVS